MDNLPSREYLLECFDYNKETGELSWKVRPQSHFKREADMKTVNKRLAGKVITASSLQGYLHVGINGKVYLQHRVIMKMLVGDLGCSHVDHINRVRSDNRECNLRLVDARGNSLNSSKKGSSLTKKTGVSPAGGQKWRSRIMLKGKEIRLGTFEDFESALGARLYAESVYGFTSTEEVSGYAKG